MSEEKILYERIMTPEGYAYEPVDMQKLIETTRQEAVEEALADFAEYCHTRYKGTTLEGQDWIYYYDSEVACMKDDYLESSKKGNHNE